jgi:5-methylthioadenosine/S-adenosylhomocysteine deaminase
VLGRGSAGVARCKGSAVVVEVSKPTLGGGPPPSVRRITNVTAFLGEELTPSIVDIRLSDRQIASIEPTSAPVAGGQRVPEGPGLVLDGTGMMAFPGMVDCHDHLRNLTPGLSLSEGVKLDDLLKVMWAAQAKMGPTEYRLGALLGSLQRLKTGITTVADHCYTFHAEGLDEASIAGYEASGIRWVYARGIMTRPYQPVCETWDLADRRIRHLVEAGLVKPDRLFIAPVSIRQASLAEFAKSRRLADDLGCGLYTHVSETAAERDVWQEQGQDTPIRVLDGLGFLTPRTVLVHGVLLDDDEIGLIAERHSSVIDCPTNHMKLAKGFTRVPDLLAAGVNVALGIDMMADMLTEMRTELGMHAAHRLDPNAVSKTEAMRMATVRGARALRLGGITGQLTPGFSGDIVLFEGRSILQAPLLDPVYSLLYATHAGLVRHVLVDGQLVIKDGQSTLVDEAALLAEVDSVVQGYLGRIGATQSLWYRRT